MNIRIAQRKAEDGSVLMVALMTAFILGLTLASYLMLVNHQHRMVVRAQAWNRAFTLAEAGVEDALAQLNRKFGTNNSRGGVNGWVGGTTGPASLAAPRQLTGGSYEATISSGMPVITATGRVAVANSTQPVERRVRVFCTTDSAFQAAMAARRDITFNGNNIAVDSYDSGDPLYNTNGKYDANKRKAGGNIASTGGFISVGNADVKGKLYTGPINAGQFSVGASGSVGSLAWSGPGIQPGWYFNDFNLPFTEVSEPFTSALPPSAGTNATTVWQLGNGNYMYVGNFKETKASSVIRVIGNATVYVTGTFEMQGEIRIDPGASLKIYVGGSTARMNTVNTSGNAFSFQYYGLPSNISVSWSGNNEYVGTVYAPEATLKMGGGGSNPYGFQGAVVVDSITLNGHFSFHFDENLRKKGPQSGYVVKLWQEE